MAREQNMQVMRDHIEEFWNQKNLDSADAHFASNATAPAASGLPPGPDGVKAVAGMIFAAFPDFHMEIDKIVANDDKVAIRTIQTGTHQGDFMGVPASGKQATWTEMTVTRFEDGKIVETFWETDMLGLMQQIGGA
jgi:steroid delta-isomerase-like uncharacterized protein